MPGRTFWSQIYWIYIGKRRFWRFSLWKMDNPKKESLKPKKVFFFSHFVDFNSIINFHFYLKSKWSTCYTLCKQRNTGPDDFKVIQPDLMVTFVVGVNQEVKVLVLFVVLYHTLEESAFCLTNVVGVALWVRTFCMVDDVVLVFFFRLIFDFEFWTKFFGVVYNLDFGGVGVWNCLLMTSPLCDQHKGVSMWWLLVLFMCWC